MQLRWTILVFFGLWAVSQAAAQTSLPLCPRVPTSFPAARPREECRGPTLDERRMPAELRATAVPELAEDLRARLPEGCVNHAVGDVDFVNLGPASRCRGEWRFATLHWGERLRRPDRDCIDIPVRNMELTWEDVVWIARMLTGEARVETSRAARTDISDRTRRLIDQHLAGLVWAAAKRQASLPRFQSDTFASYIARFSEPVGTESSYAGGRVCRERPTHCTPRKLRERQLLRSTPWEGLPLAARRIALQFALGRLDDPYPSSVDFAGHATCPSGSREVDMRGEDRDACSIGGGGTTHFCEPVGTPAPVITRTPPAWLDCSIHAVTAEERARRAIQQRLSPACRSCGTE